MSTQAAVATPLTLDPALIQNSTPTIATLPSPTSRPMKKSSFNSSIVSPPRRKSSSISPNDESALNALEIEAIAAVHELRNLVKDVYVSDKLPRTPDLIYLNLTTVEGLPFCVELTSMKGWRVTSIRHDCMNGDIAHLDLHIRYFDTMQALMEHVSPEFASKMKEILANTIPLEVPAPISGMSELENDYVNEENQTFT